MSNLIAPVNYAYNDPEVLSAGVAASVQIYKGGALEWTALGYVQPYNPADQLPFAGFADEGTVMNISGINANTVGTTNGWATIKVRRKGMVWIPYSSGSIANVGQVLYMSDDNTVSLTQVGLSLGIIKGYENGALGVDVTGYTSTYLAGGMFQLLVPVSKQVTE